MHSRMAELCRRFPDTTNAVVGFDANIVAGAPGQAECAVSKQPSKDGTEAGGAKDRWQGSSGSSICTLVNMK